MGKPKHKNDIYDGSEGIRAVKQDFQFEKVDRYFQPKTERQETLAQRIRDSSIVFTTGPAGTGKTWVEAFLAAQALDHKRIDRVILTRPTVECGDSLGFLPGEVSDKIAPYAEPLLDVFIRYFGRGQVEGLINSGHIIIKPIQLMRGCTFDNSWVIFDEAQNATARQLQMFLTRIGKNCKLLINGDVKQIDVSGSGLSDAIRRLKDINKIAHVQFTRDDVVRSGIAKAIVQAYEDD